MLILFVTLGGAEGGEGQIAKERRLQYSQITGPFQHPRCQISTRQAQKRDALFIYFFLLFGCA